MVGSEKLRSNISGIVVALVTALLFSVMYAGNYELAEHHVTAVRFGFYRILPVVAVCGVALAWVGGRRFRFGGLDWMVIGWIGYVMVRSWWIGDAVESRLEVWGALAVLYFFLRIISVSTPRAPGIMLFVFTGFCLVESVYGQGQLYGWFTSRHSLYRLTGSFFNPGPYGGFLVMGLPVVLNYCLRERPEAVSGKPARRIFRWISRVYLWATLLLICAVLPAGMSRSSWLAAVAGCCPVIVFYYRDSPWGKLYWEKYRKWRWGVFAAVVMGVGIACMGMYSLKKDSADGRLLMWKVSVRAMQENPWTGVGVGHFGGAFGRAQAGYFRTGEATEQEERVAGSPEYGFNEYLQMGVETGVIGLLLFIGVLGVAVWRAIRARTPESIGILGSLSAFAVFACFSYPLNVLPLCVVFVFLLALGETTLMQRAYVPRRHALWLPGVVAVLAGLVFFLVWNKEKLQEAYLRWGEEQKYYSMDIFEETVDHYRELYPLLRHEPRFLFEYGQCLSRTGAYEESCRVLSEGTASSADPMFYNIMGKNRQALRDYEGAELCFRRAYRMVPHRLYPLYLLARMYFESGQWEKARETSRQVLAKSPKVMSDAIREMKQEMKEQLKRLDKGEVNDKMD